MEPIRKKRKGPNFYKNETIEQAENAAGIDATIEKTDETEEEKKIVPLEVEKLDLNPLSNKFMHHTYEYEHYELIVRRGDDFSVRVTFKDTEYNKDTDQVRIKLSVGDRPLRTKGTLLDLEVKDQKLDPKEWAAICDRTYKNETTFKIMPAADAIVGRYKITIDTRRPTGTEGHVKRKIYKHPEDFIVLFNAWCKDDDVYLESKEEIEEYVMNETGLIFTNESLWHRGRDWNFGQFQKECLDCALYILGESGMAYQAMGNPIRVIRALSAMVNSSDMTGGVLQGNWTGNYEGGTAPNIWNGSVAILEEFMKTKSPVKYGQCWVFSGVCTTVCRALGIPTRSITNFSSAHDQDESMTIDYFVDSEGNPLKIQSDSVWNFHVWNEAWFKRHDLPSGNDGWQVFDATPQERSDGQYQCGPCPVSAVKRGDVFLNYDAKFIFAEVNGDKVTWMMNAKMDTTDPDLHILVWNNNGEPDMKAVQVDQNAIGESIVTKRVGKPAREIVTDNYKHKEGSKAERMVASRVSVHSSRNKDLAVLYELQKTYDVEFSFEGTIDEGGDIEIKFSANNKAAETRTMTVQTHSFVQYYAGNPGPNLSNHRWNLEVEAGTDKSKDYKIEASEYMNTMTDDGHVVIFALATVEGTGQMFSKQLKLKVKDPDLEMKTDKESVKQGEEFEVSFSLENPLHIPLTECKINLEGPGTQKNISVPCSAVIPPGGKIEASHKLKARFLGKRELIGSLNSKQLRGITGSAVVEVVADKPAETLEGSTDETAEKEEKQDGGGGAGGGDTNANDNATDNNASDTTTPAATEG